MELWDAYDKEFNIIEGKTLIRGEEIPDGMYHLVCDIYVRHIDGDVLLMQRDFNKKNGGLWEATAGGSALKGETPLECAIRELKEETGIIEAEFREVGRQVWEKYKSIYVLYLATTSVNKDSIILQEGETIDYKWISESEIENIKDELVTRRILQFI